MWTNGNQKGSERKLFNNKRRENREKIRALRERNDLTVRDLASLLCLPDGQLLCDWEAGALLPNAGNVVCLSDIFLVPIDEILVWEKRDKSPN